MPAPGELRTERLLLRRWQPSDEAPMRAINRDPEVLRYLNRPAGEAALAAFHSHLVEHWERHGFGLWAVEAAVPLAAGERGAELAAGTFLGFTGIAFPTYLPALAERPEIGWRLARRAWGRGVATEAARAAREHAFASLALPELIAIVHPENARSQAVAGKLGMTIECRVHNPLLRRLVDVWALAAPASS